MKNSRVKFILLFSILFGLPAFGQNTFIPPSFQFEIFELPGNVTSKHVQCIAQDSFGFMWFASQNGLHRWDGYQFKTYWNDPSDSTSIASNYVEYIYVAKDSSLWIGTFGEGLDHFDYETETFQHYNHQPGDATSISNDFVIVILEDQEGYLWVSTMGGVNRLDRKSKTFKQFLHDPNNPNSVSAISSRSSYMDSNGVLWFGTGVFWEANEEGGLSRYRPETEDFIHYNHDPEDPNSLLSNKVESIFEDSKGNFWVGTAGDGLHLMNRKNGTFQRLTNSLENQHQVTAPFLEDLNLLHTRFIFEDPNNKLWIGAWGAGIKYYDLENGYTKHFFHQLNDPQSLRENFAWDMTQSSDGILWFFTAGDESTVYKVTVQESLFDYFELPEKDNAVLSFFEKENQTLLLGTTKTGLLQFDIKTDELSTIDYNISKIDNATLKEFGKQSSLSMQKKIVKDITKIVEDKSEQLWMLADSPQKLIRMNPKTGELKRFQHDPKDQNSIDPAKITDILIDQKGQLWIITPATRDINLYNPSGDNFLKYQYSKDINQIVDNNHNTLMTLGADESIYIGGYKMNNDKIARFIVKFDTGHKKQVPYLATNPDFEVWSIGEDLVLQDDNDKLHKIEIDRKGNLWFCDQTTIKEVEPTTGIHRTLLNANYLSGIPYFQGFEFDEQEGLWLLTDKLIHFNPITDERTIYNIGQSIKPTLAHRQNIFKGTNHSLYFPVEGGFYRIKQEMIERNRMLTSVPEVIITHFDFPYAVGQEADKKELPNHILNTPEIYLDHHQNAFNIQFVALDFHDPFSNEFEFKLSGYDDQWLPAGSEHKASYMKVPPGDYIFQVRAAAQNKKWGEESTLKISIASPWWATWWAYALYLLLGCSLLYTFYHFQLNRKLDKAEALRLKELDDVKSRLYTNITHEFRTPLTVILGMADHLKSKIGAQVLDGDTSIEMIQRNGERLLQLVNDMLDLAKLEKGKMQMTMVQSDVIPFVKYICESFHSLAKEFEINLTVYAEVDHLTMDFDANKLAAIISNLLSNAIKFTSTNGKIIVHLNQIVKRDKEYLLIKVKDNGMGFSEEERTKIFDRFYHVNYSEAENNKPLRSNSSQGTGIGLSLTKELVELMKGTIDVKSIVREGSEFIIKIPISRKASREKEVSLPLQPQRDASTATTETDNSCLEDEFELPVALIIEDNKDVAHYIKTCLEGKYLNLHAINGKAGIELAFEKTPDIIISDVMMPLMDGYEVCATLKEDERTSHIPIILLTAKATSEDKLVGLSHGADAYLIKPFEKAELMIRLSNLMEIRQTLQKKYNRTLFNSQITNNDLDNKEDYFIEKVEKIILEHLEEEDFHIYELAKALHLSRSQVHRKVKALTGMSTAIYIRHIRLQKAKSLLTSTDLSISEIAYQVGFKSPVYFSQVFKEAFGESPSASRK